MDETKTFIKMCDCPEIRNQWPLPPKDDDLYAYPVSSHPDKSIYVHHTRKLTPEEAERVIWLPRQDQIQEMLLQKVNDWDCLEKFNGPFQMIYWLNEFRDLYYLKEHEITSMEQLWLAYYMHEKHKKTWDGEKWIAEKS